MVRSVPKWPEVFNSDQRIPNIDQKVDRQISDLVGSLTDPIICYKGQEEKPPEWLQIAITIERLMMNMAALKGERTTGTDAEAVWYLSTASLEFPCDSQWCRIYQYVFTRVYGKYRSKEVNNPVPDDLRVDELDNYDMSRLRDLKDWLYRTRVRAREDKERSDRREQRDEAKQEKEQEKRQIEALQPRMFEF